MPYVQPYAGDTLGATPEDEPLVITRADMEAATAGLAQTIQFKINGSSGMKAFAKQFGADRDALRRAWPKDDVVCMTGAALRRLIKPLELLTLRIVKMGYDLSTSGVRRLVGDEYRGLARRLKADAKSQTFGIGPVLGTLRKAADGATSRGIDEDDVEVCFDTADDPSGVGLRGRVFFLLGRIKIALEQYAFLEDIRPWFTKNRVFDFFFDVLFKIGEFVWAVLHKTGKFFADVFQYVGDLSDAVVTGLKWAAFAGGAYALYWALKPKDKKKPKELARA